MGEGVMGMIELTEYQRSLLVGPDARMSAYYFEFDVTGVPAIDAILSALAWAGKGWHHTEAWNDDDDEYSYGPFLGISPVTLIQQLADEAAQACGNIPPTTEES